MNLTKIDPAKLIYNGVTILYTHIVSLQGKRQRAESRGVAKGAIEVFR